MDTDDEPVLVVRALNDVPEMEASAPSEATAAGPNDEVAIAMAVTSLEEHDRTHVVDSLRYATARLEGRLLPFVSDLGGDDVDPVTELEGEIARYLPTLNAARALVSGSWSMRDVEVRVAASCAEAKPAPNEVCVPLWHHTAEAATTRRARFAAWAAASSAIVELDTSERARELAGRLRARTLDRDSVVALVITESDTALEPSAAQVEVEEAVRRFGRAMAIDGRLDTQHLGDLARPTAKTRPLPWLTLGPKRLMVVPRLSSLARPGELVQQVERAAAPLRPRWGHRP